MDVKRPVIRKLDKAKRKACRWCKARFTQVFDPHYYCSYICKDAYKNERLAREARKRKVTIREVVKILRKERLSNATS